MATLQKTSAEQPAQDFIRIQDLFYLCLAQWKWFLLSLFVCLGVAVAYLLTTPPVYTRSASILIKDESKGKSTSGEMDAFSDLGIISVNTNVNNEMGTLQSPDLMREVVLRLHLAMNYTVRGRFQKRTIYGETLPVRVTMADFPDDEVASFTLRLRDKGRFLLTDLTRNGEPLTATVQGTLDEEVQTPLGKLVVKANEHAPKRTEEVEIEVVHTSLRAALSSASARLTVSQTDEKSNIITLSFQDVSIQRAEDVLNTLIAVYNENWVKDKNQIAVSTSMFINERLGVIEGELGNVDDDISSYKSEHLLPDVQAAANMYMSQASQSNTAIKELNNQVYMARYILNYLTSENNRFQLLPANSGIDNANINAQITEYNNQLLERNNLVSKSSAKNPLVVEMDASLVALRKALISSIDNQLVGLEAQIKSQQRYGEQVSSQIASNPKQAKYLLSVERQQKVKESLYLYLLQKREENELSQAFTAYNTRVIMMPNGSMAPTAPVKKNILLVAFALGLLFPMVVIVLRENLNTVVRGRKDLERLSLPFVGEIPLAFRKSHWSVKQKASSQQSMRLVVKAQSRNMINEAFRVVRTNLEFMSGKESGARVIMVTSCNPNSGKTFITYNLSACLSIKGKRVIALDLDLRKATLSGAVGNPKIGIADYLAGQVDQMEEIICHPEQVADLAVIPVGTLPPNPTELLFSERMETLLSHLRAQYDYIFIDCPPAEIVADASIINTWVDQTLFVIRAGLLDRAMLPEIEGYYTEKRYKNLSMLLNGTENGSGRYGYKYGYKYGYRYGYHYGYSGYTQEE